MAEGMVPKGKYGKVLLILCMITCFFLSGCTTEYGNDTEESPGTMPLQTEEQDWDQYFISFQELEETAGMKIGRSALCSQGIYYIGKPHNSLESRLYFLPVESWSSDEWKGRMDQASKLPFSVLGSVLDLNSDCGETLSVLCFLQEDGISSTVLYQCDRNGTQQKEYRISELLEQAGISLREDEGLMSRAVVWKEERIFLVDSMEKSSLYVLDLKEQSAQKLETEYSVLDLTVLEDGKAYAAAKQGNDGLILEIDAGRGSIRPVLELPGDAALSGFAASDDQGLYINAWNGIYRLVREKEGEEWSSQKCVSLLESSRINNMESSLYLPGKAALEILMNIGGERSLTASVKAQAGEEADSEKAREKQVVVLGCSAAYDELKDLAARFNVSNPNYQVEIREYSYGEELNRMAVEIQSGKGPDLIQLRGLALEEYVEKGMLEDLTSYLEQSTALSPEDLAENVLKLNTVQGVLTCIPPAFIIETAVGRTSQLGEEMGWTTEEFMEFVKAHPGAEIYGGPLYGQSKESIVPWALLDKGSKYVDWENYKADFTSPEFISLITFAYDYESKYAGDSASIVQQIREGNVLLYNFGVWNVDDYLTQKAIFGEEVTFIGYPSIDGEPSYGIRNVQDYGIRSGSPVKEGAWAFLEYMILAQGGNSTLQDAFPTRKTALEEMFQEAEKEFLSNQSSTGQPMGKSGKWQTWQDGIKIYGAAKEDIQEIQYLIDHAVFVERTSNPVNNIVYEEVDSYFAGQKTAEETADIIQNRVQLYLDETR